MKKIRCIGKHWCISIGTICTTDGTDIYCQCKVQDTPFKAVFYAAAIQDLFEDVIE